MTIVVDSASAKRNSRILVLGRDRSPRSRAHHGSFQPLQQEFLKQLTDRCFALHLPTLLNRAGQFRLVFKANLVIFDN